MRDAGGAPSARHAGRLRERLARLVRLVRLTLPEWPPHGAGPGRTAIRGARADRARAAGGGGGCTAQTEPRCRAAARFPCLSLRRITNGAHFSEGAASVSRAVSPPPGRAGQSSYFATLLAPPGPLRLPCLCVLCTLPSGASAASAASASCGWQRPRVRRSDAVPQCSGGSARWCGIASQGGPALSLRGAPQRGGAGRGGSGGRRPVAATLTTSDATATPSLGPHAHSHTSQGTMSNHQIYCSLRSEQWAAAVTWSGVQKAITAVPVPAQSRPSPPSAPSARR